MSELVSRTPGPAEFLGQISGGDVPVFATGGIGTARGAIAGTPLTVGAEGPDSPEAAR